MTRGTRSRSPIRSLQQGKVWDGSHAVFVNKLLGFGSLSPTPCLSTAPSLPAAITHSTGASPVSPHRDDNTCGQEPLGSVALACETPPTANPAGSTTPRIPPSPSGLTPTASEALWNSCKRRKSNGVQDGRNLRKSSAPAKLRNRLQ